MAEDEAHGAEPLGGEPQDAAAEAFEALRAEVAGVRAVLEGLPTTAPDYRSKPRRHGGAPCPATDA
jgi:hypothetical protein